MLKPEENARATGGKKLILVTHKKLGELTVLANDEHEAGLATALIWGVNSREVLENAEYKILDGGTETRR